MTAATGLSETPAASQHLSPLQTATIPAAKPTGPNIPGARNKDQATHTRLARAHIRPGLEFSNLCNGKKHDRTLCLVAMNWMVFNGQHLDRRKATSIKRAVDRAYVELKGEKPPPVPRGWWHPKRGLGTTPGGLQMLGLA